MRASRVISLLGLLEQHGRLTAAQLAAELEVSQRTILRDVETLSAAGIPIYATQGSGGGIRLVDGFSATLSAITTDDASGLLWAGQPRVASLLGLGPAADSGRRRLMTALTPAQAASAAAADGWFLHDPAGRAGLPFDPDLLPLIVRAIRLRVELRTPDSPAPLRPLGLVLEAGRWQLVHRAAAGPAVMEVADLHGSFSLGRAFARPEGFDLHRFWSGLSNPGRRCAARRA